MGILGFIHILTENDLTVAAISLLFNPIKLFFLIVWVYLCFYFIQRIQFSPLIPHKYKSVSYIITLFAGPIFWLILLIVDTSKKAVQTNVSILELFKQQIHNIIRSIQSRGFAHFKQEEGIQLLDSSGRSMDEIYGHGDKKREESKILDLTKDIISDAIEQRSSDILIDPTDDITYTIRLRIDGVLREVKQIKSVVCKAIINSIKAISGMDIAEKRRPQDGAFIAKKAGQTISFRVASAGVINGEKLSIRILNRNASTSNLIDIGITQKQYSVITDAISKPSGMILLCGPTGSGKTTTLYAMLNEIDRYTRNVITVEDPIEAVLPTASQIEINPKADITFAKSLRSILRQDPDVICVGEIRDEETAEIALRAAQTGHLVFATIHCDSNKTALVRLLDLGISPLLISSGLILLSSQRLLRRLCERCKVPAELSDGLIKEFKRIKLDYTNIFEAEGCKHCNETGYYDRIAVCDLLTITEQLKADINKIQLTSELETGNQVQIKSHLKSEGLKKVALGITSLEEIKRVLG